MLYIVRLWWDVSGTTAILEVEMQSTVLASNFSGLGLAGLVSFGLMCALSWALAHATRVLVIRKLELGNMRWLLPMLIAFWFVVIVATRFQVHFPLLRLVGL